MLLLFFSFNQDLSEEQGVLHNGPAINLISTIDMYDKFVITRGKIKKQIYFNVHHHVIVKEKKFMNPLKLLYTL